MYRRVENAIEAAIPRTRDAGGGPVTLSDCTPRAAVQACSSAGLGPAPPGYVALIGCGLTAHGTLALKTAPLQRKPTIGPPEPTL